MLPPAEVTAIHAALTASAGDRAKAADDLGLTPAELAAKIRESAELTTLWAGGAAPQPPVDALYDRARSTPAEVIDEEPPVDLGGGSLPDGVSERDAAVSQGFLRQETKLQQFDWEGLGVQPGAAALMRQFEAATGRGIMRMVDAMVGGMGYCFSQVSYQFAYASEQLQKIRDKTGEAEMGPTDKTDYAYWHQVWMDCAREMKSFNKEATNAMHTRLLIADRARKMQSAAGGKMKRPGWKRVQSTDPNAKGASVNASGGGYGG